MNPLLIADNEARRRIREEINTNFFVEAGAGSGKTTALVDRMVAMVEGGIEVEKICAITFTVAASREFFDRFQKKLIERRSENGLPGIVRERIEYALQHIDLCFMGTIDSFCNQILSEHPTRAGVPSVLGLIEDTEKTALYRREYARLKRGEYGEELLELFHGFSAVQSKPDDAFLDSISCFMDAHAANWIMPEMPDEDWRKIFSKQFEQLYAVLERIDEKRENISDNQKDRRAAKDYLPDALRHLGGYKSETSFSDILFDLIKLTASDDETKMDGLSLICEPKSIGVDAEPLFVMRGKRTMLYCLCLSRKGGLIQRLREYQYAVTVRFLSAFAVKIAETLKEKGELSFYDYLLYLRNMLREDAASGGKLVRHIRAHYSYFLIDEFQDTDPNQAEVFFRLSSETPAVDWRDCKLLPGSLFIVGDPKQSIYRFRGADVSSYLSVKELFVPPVGDVLSLSQNFRSTVTLRKWFNNTFETLLPEETTYQSKFDAIPIEDGDEDGELFSGVLRYQTSKSTNPGDVAEIIRRIVDNPDFLIQTQKEKKKHIPPHRIHYKDIMVITRTRTPLAECLLAMRDYGIPCGVDGRTAFVECPAFLVMTDLLSAFADPSDSCAVYNVLRGQLFGFSRKEITAWVDSGNKLHMFGHEGEENEISAALVELNEFRQRTIMLSPSALCTAMLEEFHLFSVCGTANMEYVWFAIELLRNGTDKLGNKSLTDASSYLKELAEGNKDPGKVLDLNGERDHVYLANLHRVKGLEAPIVILAQTSYSKKSPEIHMEPDGMNQKRWTFKLTGQGFGAATYAVTERYEEEENREAVNLDAEEIRLMYVAATRAGCVLLVPDTGEECLWDSLLTAETEDLETVLPPETENEKVLTGYGYEQNPNDWDEMIKENPLLNAKTENETWQLNLPSNLHDKDMEPESECEPDADAELPRGEVSSLLMGTVIHRAMEMLVSSRSVLSDEMITNTIREEYVLEDGEENADTLAVLANTLKTIRHGGWKQETGVPDDILSVLLSADEVYCEVPFCVRSGNVVTSGIMDAVYRKGAQWYVVDYKTNANPYGLDQVYKDQLTAYRNATRQLFGEIADVHTYHIPLLKE